MDLLLDRLYRGPENCIRSMFFHRSITLGPAFMELSRMASDIFFFFRENVANGS